MTSYIAKALNIGLGLQQYFLTRIQHPKQLRWIEKILLPLIHLPKHCEMMPSDLLYTHIKNLHTTARPNRILIYVHGGGFNLGNPELYHSYASRLMQAAEFGHVILPRYRRAPEYPFPAASDDLFKFWQQLTKDFPNAEIYLAGESAGANLALSLCLKLRQHNMILPKKLFLHSGWFDLAMRGESYYDPEVNDSFIGRLPQRHTWLFQIFGQHYVGQADVLDPLVSPLYGDFSDFPPCYIMAAEREIFRSDSEYLAEKLNTAAVNCHLEIWSGMWHAFATLAPLLPEANQAIKKIGLWFRQDAVIVDSD